MDQVNLHRLRKLLRTAVNGGTPNERATAARKALSAVGATGMEPPDDVTAADPDKIVTWIQEHVGPVVATVRRADTIVGALSRELGFDVSGGADVPGEAYATTESIVDDADGAAMWFTDDEEDDWVAVSIMLPAEAADAAMDLDAEDDARVRRLRVGFGEMIMDVLTEAMDTGDDVGDWPTD